MKGFKMIDKTEIYLYLHSEYALRINITRSERIEDRRKKVVVQKENKETLVFMPDIGGLDWMVTAIFRLY